MPSNTVCMKGKLTDEGVECQAFRSDAGDLYTLTGDLSGYQNGDVVIVCGLPVENSTCMQGTTIDLLWITDDVDEALEESLKQEIKSRWADKFIEAKWKKTPFSKYTSDGDDPKVVVLHATRRVAAALGNILTPAVEQALQAHVDLSTTPEDALPLMKEALG